uniref:protein bicaudal D homolog 1-like n=1 Tax=Styela clava TaxID=7725 RepID=UPI00193AB7BE|nr:protein bicaudal D homolog 1-like [Styela clava]
MDLSDDVQLIIDRLTHDLEEAQQEKIQAAEYGLQVLDEKQKLQQRYDELEVILDSTQRELDASKNEFELSKRALENSQHQNKRVFHDGETREQTLLQQKEQTEETLISTIQDLESELIQTKQTLKNVSAEVDGLSATNGELASSYQTLEKQKSAIKRELKETRVRESRLLNDYTELEEENCNLQKQVSALRQSQAEYEGFQHEIKRLEEEAEFLNSQLEEALKLKELLESQLEEALDTLAKEREHKMGLKKELSQYVNNIYDTSFAGQIDFSNNSSFNDSFHVGKDGKTKNNRQTEEYDEDLDNPLMRHITADLKHSTPAKMRNGQEHSPAPSVVADLLSELNISEVAKLKQQLMQVEKEKKTLLNNLNEQQKLLDNVKGDKEKSFKVEPNNDVSREVEALREELRNVQETQEQRELEAIKMLQSTLSEERKTIQFITEKKKELECDMKELITTSDNHIQDFKKLSDDLSGVSEQLSHLYHHTCLINRQTPNRIVLDHVKNQTHQAKDGKENDNANLGISEVDSGDPASPIVIVATILDQITHLKQAVDQLAKSKELAEEGESVRLGNSPDSSTSEDHKDETEVQMLEEEVMRLRSLLSSKREQIATLRTVLKANKHTAEVALSNLKSKYQHEKGFVSETMLKLRAELKALKEDAATFASLRAMFAARCDEYVTQLDDMQRQLSAADSEKRTLNQLLRMAIQQKLALTQRLEDLEFDREQHTRQLLDHQTSTSSTKSDGGFIGIARRKGKTGR